MASSLSLFFLNGCNLKGSYPIQEKVQKPPLVLSTSTIYATCFGQTTLLLDFLLQKQKSGSIVLFKFCCCTLRCLKMCEQLWLWFVWLFAALEVLRTFFVAAPERGCRKLHKSQITVMANFKIRFSRKTLTWLPHAFTLCGEILPCCHQWSRQSWPMDNSDQHYNKKVTMKIFCWGEFDNN